ncbi:Uncharacterised protein [Collinsella aerofaciens]|nr:Uncharacterised protein [Collinsella aerofaciens]
MPSATSSDRPILAGSTWPNASKTEFLKKSLVLMV